MSDEITNRRDFLAGLVAVPALAFARPFSRARLPILKAEHPEPRAGITAAKVATAEQLKDDQDLIPLFDQVREIPQIMDGIRCQCGCAERPDFYSLLSCYEGADAMAMDCHQCQNEGKLVTRLHKQGRSLKEIRAAIDDRFGGGQP